MVVALLHIRDRVATGLVQQAISLVMVAVMRQQKVANKKETRAS